MMTAAPASATLPRWRDPRAWLKTADVFAVLAVASLPWSTSLPAIFIAIWLIVLLPAIDPRDFLEVLRRPASYVPVVFFALAVVGVLWSEGPWSVRFYAVKPVAKLLVLPLLFYHFRHSTRIVWVLGAYLASCALLMLLSWLVAYDPRFALKLNDAPEGYGVPVKNYIAQSQEFALCAIALAWPVMDLIRRGRYRWALAFAALGGAFILNMMFVTVSRTALVTLPVMIGAFALVHLRWRAIVALGAAAVGLVALLWVVSPTLQTKLGSIVTEFDRYQTSTDVTSGGLRLEFWRKSLVFFSQAPVIGHGTGATVTLFKRASVDQQGVAAEVIGNPHNQTLNVAVQWGMVGVAILYLMWLCHLLLFVRSPPGSELVAWIGLLVVVQNVASSLFNSHLFDFHEGWIYVLGVGVAGGVMMRARTKAS